MTEIARLVLAVDSRDVEDGHRALDGLGDQAERTEDRTTRATSQMAGGFKVLGAAIAAVATSQMFNEIVRGTAQFEQGMRNVAAVSGSTEAQLEALTDAALRAAASTRFNPSQTTQALYALASSGQAADEQMASLTNVLNLAEAGQADLGRATELMTSTLNQFGLGAEASQRVADVFVASIGASALNVDRLQVALRNAGPTAAALGQSLEGTTAALGLLTTAFGNGERAGTGLRAIFNELPEKAEGLGVAVRDSTGEFRPLVDIIADLEAQGVTASQVVGTFGAEAGPALAALLSNGSDALQTMEGRLQSTGQAADTAGEQLDTLQGDIDAFASSMDVAFISIGDSQEGVLRDAVQTATNLVRLWSGYGDTLGDAEESTEALSNVIEGLALLVAGKATSAVAGFTAAKAKAVAASIAEAKAEATATAQVARRSAAELVASRQIQARAVADAKATAGTNAHAFAMDHLVLATDRATAAQARHAAASTAAAAAAGRASVAARGLSVAMGLLGGPVGIAVLAAGALYTFREELGLVQPELKASEEDVAALTGSIDDLSRATLENKISTLTADLEDLRAKTQEAVKESTEGLNAIGDIYTQGVTGGRTAGSFIEAGAASDVLAYEQAIAQLQEQLAALNDSEEKAAEQEEERSKRRQQQVSESIQKRIDALQLEAETLDMTATKAALYRLEVEGASPAQLKAAEAAYRRIDAYEAEQKALEEQAEFKKSLETDLGEIQERYASERELLGEDLMLRREKILESYELGLIDKQETNELLLAAQEEYYAESEALRQDDVAREQRASAMVTSARNAAAQQGIGLLQLFARENETVAHVVLGVQTALSAAMAWTNTLVAATRAVAELGPIAGPPAAASIMAWGKLQVGLIAATGLAKGFMGGGGGGSPSGGGGGGGFGGSPEAAPPSPLLPQERDSGNSLTVVFQGDVTGFDQDELADKLINKMGDEINNLDRVVIDPKSRNGRMLRGR